MRCDSLQPTRTAALTDASHRSKALLLAHALFLLLCAWLSLSAVRGRLGGGASGAARARLDSDLQQPLLAALLDAGAAGGGKTPGGTLPAWLGAGGWEFPVPPEQLDRGVVSEGDPAAAARLARKLLSGQPISVAALGGSLTFGKGASSPGRTDWVSLLAAWLRDSFPTGSGNSSTAGRHVVVNAAVAASPSEYISFCLQQHLDPQHPPDLVLVSPQGEEGVNTVCMCLTCAHAPCGVGPGPGVGELCLRSSVYVEWGRKGGGGARARYKQPPPPSTLTPTPILATNTIGGIHPHTEQRTG
jgi:hypothetical protein